MSDAQYLEVGTPEDVLCLVVPCRLARTTYSLIPPVAFDCGGVELHIGEVVLGTASAQRNRGRASNAVLTGPHQHNPHIRPSPCAGRTRHANANDTVT
jgi:hypothetical protein